MVIPVNGLANGRTEYTWRLDSSFFGLFDNLEVKCALVDVVAEVEKSGRFVGVDIVLKGNVVVECDRCLEDLTLPIDAVARLSVKFGEGSGSAETDDREVVTLPEGDAELDIDQIVYDYCCLALPVQRVHEDGGCNPEVMKRLAAAEEEEAQEVESGNNPFAALRSLIEDNNRK